MKKLVLLVAVCAALVSCSNNKAKTEAASTTTDTIAQATVTDTLKIIDLTGNWVAETPTTPAVKGKEATPAPSMDLKADKTAEVKSVPATSTPATKDAKASTTPVKATWKQNPASPATNNNGTLVLFTSIPGKHKTDSVAYEIINATDSSLTIQGAAGVFKFKKH